MGLTREFIGAHIKRWERKLNGPVYPHRRNWPKHLFHHAPLENAVRILSSGQLLSRIGSTGFRVRDIAGSGVIDSSNRAHHFVRVFFRPRTPTQFHIEGIRKPNERNYGEGAHAPVLIMFVFDARQVLSLQNVSFSRENMQSGAIEGSTPDFFQTIPFEKVYHQGGIAGDRSIISHRCAEVLAPSPMPLENYLRWIYCRSEAERTTLINSLGERAARWKKLIRVSDDLQVFEKRFTFVEAVSISNEGVIFRLHPRHDQHPISIRLTTVDSRGRVCVKVENSRFQPQPPNASSWRVKCRLWPGRYNVRIDLEEQLAYEATLTLDDVPF